MAETPKPHLDYGRAQPRLQGWGVLLVYLVLAGSVASLIGFIGLALFI